MYTVTFTRPYLTGDDRFNIQRERISARNEQQVRDIFADCEIINIEADCEEELEASRKMTPKTTEADADALHDLLEALDNGDWLGEVTARQYGDADLTQIVNGTSSPEWWDAQKERSL